MKRSRPLTWLRRGGAVSVLAVLVTLALAAPASADGEGETTEGYLLVQQALGHLAHDTSHEGMALAMEKVEDALATEDQDGVDVADSRARPRPHSKPNRSTPRGHCCRPRSRRR